MKAESAESDLEIEPARPSTWRTVGRGIGLFLTWLALLLCNLWAVAALWVDCRIAALRLPLTAAYVISVVLLIVTVKRLKALASLACFCVVLAWWLSLKPSNNRHWREDVSRTAAAELHGNQITIRNLRNCNYRSETEYTGCWSDRSFDLSHLRGVDFFFVNWGIPWIGHPIVSFDFGDGQHLAFSIEARYQAGQSYSAVLGFFRQYELIFIAADERDLVRLRTNYRKDEEVYIYRTTVSPDVARKLFLAYANYLNQLKDHPEWYNAVTRNCTTAIDQQIRAQLPGTNSWTYQLLLNGSLDALEFNRDRLVTEGLPFAELKEREHINPFARTIGDSPDFSNLIRVGRVGFSR